MSKINREGGEYNGFLYFSPARKMYTNVNLRNFGKDFNTKILQTDQKQ